YGLYSDRGGFSAGCATSIPATVASGPAGSGAFGWDDDQSYADWYGGHELGHAYGRKHPGFCGETEDDDDFPYAGGQIGSATMDTFGFDVGDPPNSVPMRVYEPDEWTDVMTYCANQWISPYTYTGILEQTRLLAAIDGFAGVAQINAEAILILGDVDLDTDTVILEPFARQVGFEVTERPGASDFEIVMFGDGDRRLNSYPFTPVERSEPTPGVHKAMIAEVVPWIEGTKRIAITRRRDGATREIASRVVSARVPSVRVLSPNGGENYNAGSFTARWQGSDDDGDELSYTVLYSGDDGASWQTLRASTRETSVELDVGELAGSESAKLRVIVSDGVHTLSDDSDAVFRVAGKAPVAMVRSPETRTRIASDDTLVLRGEAYDVDDGDLDGGSLRWTSDRDGDLGSGRSVSATGLSPGIHAVTLEATDSSGQTGSDWIRVDVDRVRPVAVISGPSRASRDEMVQLSGALSRGRALEYEWRLVRKPDGSTASAVSTGATARFLADRLGIYVIQLTTTDSGGERSVVQKETVAQSGLAFLRGDVNASSRVDIADAVSLLDLLFQGAGNNSCAAAADANGDSARDLSDAIYILSFLFLGGPRPDDPYPSCGAADSALGCLQPHC
ncbi:MAG: hypothetical protein AAF517_08740, partial [Planctomycetota bacterium]